MKKTRRYAALVSCALACAAAQAQLLEDLRQQPKTAPKKAFSSEIKIKADYMSANRQTGELSATGNVQATSGVFRFRSNKVSRDPAGLHDFGTQTLFTTCTNELCNLHWKLKGHFQYQDATLKQHPEMLALRTSTNAVPLAANDSEALFIRDAWLYWL